MIYICPPCHLSWYRQALTKFSLKTAERRIFLVTLTRLVKHHERLPDSVVIPERIETLDKIPSSGGFADVWSGSYMGRSVAVKVLRISGRDGFSKARQESIKDVFPITRDVVSTILLQRFCEQAVLWKKLSHPNVLRLVGVQGDMETGQFSTISEMMVRGNIMEYVKRNHVNRLELARDSLSLPSPSLKCDSSCTGQPRVWSTSTAPV